MMAEFAGLEDNWGLQAFVGGGSFTSSFCGADSAVSAVANSCHGVMDMPKDHDRDLFISFPDLFETSAMLTDELDQLYKPFYPVSGSSPSAENILDSSISVAGEVEEKSGEAAQKQICSPVQSAISSAATAYVPKYRRRKNQHKRVVVQVTAEDLSSDRWAWRKYGQKPIKGSPYPRSYYRCSSSKGCLARKQVEQSCTDPSTFIITYTEEHNHSQPTKKNALAGTIRNKFPNPKSPCTSTSKPAKAKDSGASSPASSSAVLSPQTPLIESIDNEFYPRNVKQSSPASSSAVLSPLTPLIESIDNEFDPRNVKQEISMEEIGKMIHRSDDNVIFSDIKLDDDFFSGLEDLDELISELAYGHCSTKQFPNEQNLNLPPG